MISADKADKKARVEKESRQEQERMVCCPNIFHVKANDITY